MEETFKDNVNRNLASLRITWRFYLPKVFQIPLRGGEMKIVRTRWNFGKVWFLPFIPFLMLKATLSKYGTSNNIKVIMICVYKECEVKMKMVQEEWKFLFSRVEKPLLGGNFSGGEEISLYLASGKTTTSPPSLLVLLILLLSRWISCFKTFITSWRQKLWILACSLQ